MALTGNEVAVALKGVQLGLAWHRKNYSGSDFEKAEIAKLEAVNTKLNNLLDDTDERDGDGEAVILIRPER